MDHKKITKDMLEFNKNAFDTTFNTIVTLQQQAEVLGETVYEKIPNIPAESKKAVKEWVDGYKKAREEFKKSVDENYAKVIKYFGL